MPGMANLLYSLVIKWNYTHIIIRIDNHLQRYFENLTYRKKYAYPKLGTHGRSPHFKPSESFKLRNILNLFCHKTLKTTLGREMKYSFSLSRVAQNVRLTKMSDNKMWERRWTTSEIFQMFYSFMRTLNIQGIKND